MSFRVDALIKCCSLILAYQKNKKYMYYMELPDLMVL